MLIRASFSAALVIESPIEKLVMGLKGGMDEFSSLMVVDVIGLMVIFPDWVEPDLRFMVLEGISKNMITTATKPLVTHVQIYLIITILSR